jgi:hypothetical protein
MYLLPLQGQSVSDMYISLIYYISEVTQNSKTGKKLFDLYFLGYFFIHDFELPPYLINGAIYMYENRWSADFRNHRSPFKFKNHLFYLISKMIWYIYISTLAYLKYTRKTSVSEPWSTDASEAYHSHCNYIVHVYLIISLLSSLLYCMYTYL